MERKKTKEPVGLSRITFTNLWKNAVLQTSCVDDYSQFTNALQFTQKSQEKMSVLCCCQLCGVCVTWKIT